MKRKMLFIGVFILVLFMALPAMSQPRYGYGPGYDDEYDSSGQWTGRGWGPGYGMGRGGMMGYGIYTYVPQKLPVPKNKEWIGKLREILALEKLSLEHTPQTRRSTIPTCLTIWSFLRSRTMS